MKKIFIFLLLNFFVAGNLFAQKEDRNWVFGDSIRIDFNNLSNPTVHHANCFNNETNASISDGFGNLLMYLSIQNYWVNSFSAIINRLDEIMENGDTIMNNYSASDGSLFLPINGTSRYYFFTLGPVAGQFNNSLLESIVDTNFNSGLGKVISKNILLDDSLTEHLVAIKHANGRDWWVISKKYYTNQFVKFLLTPNGILGPYFQNIGSVSFSYIGECVASRDGNKLCFVNSSGNRDIFNFDRCNGDFSNWIELGIPPYNQSNLGDWLSYGCEFSEDGMRIYINSSDSGFTTKIEQYSINNGNPIATKTTIFPPTQDIYFCQMQLGPDDKIYISGALVPSLDSCWKYLSTINSPNDSGSLCNLDLYSFYMEGHLLVNGLPNMPNYNLSELVGSGCDTLNLGINDVNKNANPDFNIFPIPTDGNFTITTSITIQQTEVINLLGEKVYSLRCNTPTQTLHLTTLSKGVYFIRLKTADGLVMKKVVVE